MDDPHVLVIGENEYDFHRFDDKGPLFEGILVEAGCTVSLTTVREELQRERLRTYDVVLDYLTTPPAEYTEDIRSFVSDGGGFVGIHCAADVSTFADPPADELAALIGGRFVTHPEQATFGVTIRDPDHPITDDIEDFEVFDEPYDISMESDQETHLLADMVHPAMDGTPVAWTREEGDGRVFYCSLGHTDQAFETPAFRTLLIRGVRWASKAM